MELDGWEDGEDLGGGGRGEAIIKIYCMKSITLIKIFKLKE